MFDFAQIHLDFRAKIPIYVQLSEQLRQQIEHGVLAADEQLPPVRLLAEKLRVNFNTVARAYRVLDIEGWISTQQGRGTYITTQSWPRSLIQISQPGDDSPAPVSPVEAPGEHAPEEMFHVKQVEDAPAMPVDRTEAPKDQGLSRPDETIPTGTYDPGNNVPLPIGDHARFPHRDQIRSLIYHAVESGISLDEIHAYLQELRESIPSLSASSRRKRPITVLLKQNRRRHKKIYLTKTNENANIAGQRIKRPTHAMKKNRIV